LYQRAELTQDETQIVTDFSYLNAIDSENFIVPRAAKLRFEAGYQPVTLGDYRFEEFFRDAIHLEEIDDDSVEWNFIDCTINTLKAKGIKVEDIHSLNKQIQGNGKKPIKNITSYGYKSIQMIL